MNREIGQPVDARKDVDVACDERTLRDDGDAEPGMLRQHVQNSTRDAESPLGRLIRIGCRSDHDGFTVEQLQVAIAAESQGPAQDFGCVLFDKDVALEGQPRRELVIRFAKCVDHFLICGGALHHPAVRVARVTVGASERAADVRIDRPESHARRLGTIEDVLRGRGVVADVFLLADDRQLARLSFVRRAK